MKTYKLALLITVAIASCEGGNTKQPAVDEAATDSMLSTSPGVVPPPADTAQYNMPVQQKDTSASDMPVIDPVDPKVQPK